jgi:thiamine kinase-like enzyme
MTSALQPILDRIPLFANQTDRVVSELSGGITNRNYKIETGGAVYVLRLVGKDTDLLGIDREVEYACNLAAARAGVAPEPVAFDLAEGYLVTRFVAGDGIPAEAIGTPANIARVMGAVKRYHALESFPGFFSPFRVVESFLPIAQKYQAPLPQNVDWFVGVAAEIETAFQRNPMGLKPCHNDLLNGNFIDTGEALYILDWEYGGMDDPFFDLANFSAQHGFGVEQDEIVVREYFGEVTKARLARQQLMKIMSDMREAFWAMVQCNVSTIEFDYVGYGQKYFERITATARDPHYKQWLGEVE